MPEMRMMATTGMLGYGYTEEAFRRGLEQKPDFIAADGGSMDPGPYYLGEGIPFVSRKAMKRDLALMIEAGIEHNIPVMVGSAGGGGSDPQVAFVREIAEEIAKEKGLSFRMAVIHAEQPKDFIKPEKSAKAKSRRSAPIADLDRGRRGRNAPRGGHDGRGAVPESAGGRRTGGDRRARDGRVDLFGDPADARLRPPVWSGISPRSSNARAR